MEAEEPEMMAVLAELVLEPVAKESMEMAEAAKGLVERAAAAAVRGSVAKPEKAAGEGSEEGLMVGPAKGLVEMEED